MRNTIQASAVANYMGLGFRSPQDQLQIDLGLDEPIFSADQKERMRLGTVLEDAVLDYFQGEQWLNEVIFDRNTDRRIGMDHMVSYMIDGRTQDAIVDCKVSASQESFIFNKGYEVQMNIYMESEGLDKAHLLGLDKGVPTWRTLHKNEELLFDIKVVVSNVYAILMGILPPDMLDLSVAEKYSGTIYNEDEEVVFDEEKDLAFLMEMVDNKTYIKNLQDRNKEIDAYFKDKYPFTKFANDKVSISIVEQSRKGSLDKAKVLLDYPDLDFDKYVGEPTTFKVIRTKEIVKK